MALATGDARPREPDESPRPARRGGPLGQRVADAVVALWRRPAAQWLVRETYERPGRSGAVATTALLLSAFLFANLPLSSFPGDVGWLESLRSVPGVRGVGISLAVLAMGLLAMTWVGVGRELLASGGDARRVRNLAATWAAPLVVAPPLFSGDAWSYAAQGVVASRGLDPYVFGPAVLNGPVVEAVSGVWLFTPAPYGPLGIVGAQLAGYVTSDPFLIVVWVRLLAVAGLAMLALAVPHLARWCRADPAVAMWLVVANPAVIAHFVAGAHNDALMIGFAALAVAYATRGRWRVAALLVGAAAAVKFTGVLAAVAVIGIAASAARPLAQRVKRVAAIGGLSLAVVVAAGLLTGLGQGWVKALGVPGIVEQALSVTTQVGRLFARVLEVSGVPDSDLAVTIARTLGMVAACVIVLALLRKVTPPSAVRSTGLAFLAVVVLGPVVYPWYLLWCLPFLGTQRLGRRSLTGLALASVLLAVTAPLYESSIDAVAMTASVVVIVLLVGIATTSRLLTLLPENALLGAPVPEREAVAAGRGIR